MSRTRRFVRGVLNQIDALLGKLLITVLLGKFGGDLASYYLSQHYPEPVWMWIGFTVAVLLVIIWIPFERAYLKG